MTPFMMSSFNELYFGALLLIAIHTICGQNHTRFYEGHKIIRFFPDSTSQLKHLEAFVNSHLGDLDVWKSSHQVRGAWDILFSPKALGSYKTHLGNVKHEILTRDIDRDIENDRKRNEQAHTQSRRRRRSVNILDSHDHYRDADEIQSWLNSKAEQHKNATITIIGHTYEHRPLLLLKISKDCNKPIIWIDAGIHAREWIAPATALLLIDFLLEDSPEAKLLLDKFQFYIVPLLNPDGYEYTQKYARLWRKNRSRSSRSNCLGVDLNRNYPFKWGGGGSSENPCADTYRGKRSHSELETQAVMSALNEVKGKLKLFISLHSYGQLIMTPFGHALSTYPRFYGELMTMSHKASYVLYKKYRKFYMIGSSADVIYAATGGSCDYAAGILDIPYSVTIELPDRGRYGFLLPPEHIVDVGKQMWDLLQQYGESISI